MEELFKYYSSNIIHLLLFQLIFSYAVLNKM